MPELDRYIPGVPCWAPTPTSLTRRPQRTFTANYSDGTVERRGSRRRTEQVPGSARIRGGDVAAIASYPEGERRRSRPGTPTSGSRTPMKPLPKVEDAGGTVLVAPDEVPGQGRMAVFADREGAHFSAGAGRASRVSSGQRTRQRQLQRSVQPRPRGRQRVLWCRFRLGHTPDLGPGGFMWTLPRLRRASQQTASRKHGEPRGHGGAGGFRKCRRKPALRDH